MPRRRREDEDFVDLGAPEHEWWAKRPTDPFAVVPDTEPAPADAENDRDTDADPLPGPGTADETDDVVADRGPMDLDDGADPYSVLHLPHTATWDEIVASYRRLARWWHPDGLDATAEWGREACEAKIRQLNAAYGELRIRRGR